MATSSLILQVPVKFGLSAGIRKLNCLNECTLRIGHIVCEVDRTDPTAG